MNLKKTLKQETKEQIQNIFSNNPSQSEIKKAKKLAMSKNISLKKLRKKFCKKCLTFFKPDNHTIKIKKPLKIIKCKTCNHVSRYKLS